MRRQLVRDHGLDTPRAQYALTVELTPVQKHLRESQKIIGGRQQSAAAPKKPRFRLIHQLKILARYLAELPVRPARIERRDTASHIRPLSERGSSHSQRP